MDQKKMLSFVNSLKGPLPKLLVAGLQFSGLKEYPGKDSNNPVIMHMASSLGISNIYPNDETAWCALFMCFLCFLTGKPMPFTQYEIIRAASFKEWGDKAPFPEFCDTLVFNRPEGYHVGLYIAETNNTYIVYGGNQSNSVGFTEINKSRLIAVRRYYATSPPECVKKYYLNSSGEVSVNEK